MARASETTALAGYLICFIAAASLVVSVSSAGVIFSDSVESEDIVTAWVPQVQAEASPSPTSTPAAVGTCPEDYTKNFWNMFKVYTTNESVVVSADGDSAQLRLDQISGMASRLRLLFI